MSPQKKFGLNRDVVRSIKKVISGFTQGEVLIYGSRALGTMRPGSDIDLVIKAPELTTSDLLRMEGELDDLLLPFKIDLSLFHHIDNRDLIDHIERAGRPFQE